jgi:hypothetical protein
MPELTLTKTNFDAFFVYATMAHPDNERYREEFIASQVIHCNQNLTSEDADLHIPKSIMSVLINSPSLENVTERASKSAYGGAVAGDILLYIAEMHLTGHKEPSVRKAVYLAEDYLANAVDGYGKKGATSNISIRKCWEEYKTVAHLWAAFRVCQLTPDKDFSNLYDTLFGDNLGQFLAIAEAYRHFGEVFKPSRIKSQESLLPKNKTWRVPEDYKLPSINLGVTGMSKWMVARLKTFKN